MRLSCLSTNALVLTLTLLLPACGSSDNDGGDAANAGVSAEFETDPDVTIDDESGTEVRVFVHLEHYGGPDVETLEVVSAGLRLDLEPYADLELAIPEDHPPFAGLADGDSLDFELRGTLADTH